jgi:Ca-activated chloride channel family protein
MRGRLLIILLAVAAVAIAATARGGEEPRENGSAARDAGANRTATPAPGGVHVQFVYSPEKEEMLVPLIKRFNADRHEVDGETIVVDGVPMNSGEAETRIAAERLKPVVWSPASSLWGSLLNFETDRPLAPRDSKSLVQTPLVIAMWEPMARALGWPRRQIGFEDLLRLSRSRAGWGDHGHPEYGPFKLVHPSPDFSTSGLAAIAAEYYAATGKRSGLTEDDVTASAARKIVRDLEASILHYGENTLFVSEQMRKLGPGYASAVAMEETTLLDFNQHPERGENGLDKLVALYPPEGTLVSDNPYFVLDAAWVTESQAKAARAFQRFLTEEITPQLAAESGFRLAGKQPPPPLTAENGVDPGQPKSALEVPEPRVLAAIRRAWREDRKPARIMLVLDTSQSMNQSLRLKHAVDGVHVFLDQMERQDSVGLMTFSDEVPPPLAPVRAGNAHRKRVAELIDGLHPNGATALNEAADTAMERMKALPPADSIDAVVLLTDGEDTDSEITASDVMRKLERDSEDEHRVRLFTIAYAVPAAEKTLENLAAAGGGDAYTADTDDIESIYRRIAAFF